MKLIVTLSLLLYSFTAVAQNRETFPERKFISNDSMLVLLNNYYTNTGEKLNPYFLPPKDKLSKKVKDELITILKRDWPDSIIKTRVEEEFKHDFEYIYIIRINKAAKEQADVLFLNRFIDIRKKSQSDTSLKFSKEYSLIYDSVYHKVYDSVAVNFKIQAEEKIRESKVPDEIILSAGVLKIKEAVPILRNDLNAVGKHYFGTDATEIALAGLGDTVLQKKYFRKHDNFVKLNQRDETALWKDFLALALTINTQESVSKLADWMDTSKTYTATGETGNYYQYYTGAYMVPDILWFIKNKNLREAYIELPMKEGHTSYYDEYGVTYQQILFLKNWFIKNKGKYEFD